MNSMKFIPKDARDVFNIRPGDTIVIVGDEKKGLAIVKVDALKEFAVNILTGLDGIKSAITGDGNKNK